MAKILDKALQASSGYRVIDARPSVPQAGMAEDVLKGLNQPPGQKTLPCMYLYDARGSELYEKITRVPEYYPTRTEAALLESVAPELKHLLPETRSIAELGSGSSTKTRILLDAWHADREDLSYIPIDVSASMLKDTVRSLTQEYPPLRIIGMAGQYEDALSMLPPDPGRLFLFLGGTIGNFAPQEQTRFFTRLRKNMGSGASLLVGFDRRPHAGKPVEVIVSAYNDSRGVTADFNLNMLLHINQRLGADFDIRRWRHEAIYNQTAHRIEMHLESTCKQRVYIGALERAFDFESGERILTEISRKFDPDELREWFKDLGYRAQGFWTGPNQLFGLLLLKA